MVLLDPTSVDTSSKAIKDKEKAAMSKTVSGILSVINFHCVLCIYVYFKYLCLNYFFYQSCCLSRYIYLSISLSISLSLYLSLFLSIYLSRRGEESLDYGVV